MARDYRDLWAMDATCLVGPRPASGDTHVFFFILQSPQSYCFSYSCEVKYATHLAAFPRFSWKNYRQSHSSIDIQNTKEKYFLSKKKKIRLTLSQ